MPRRAFPRLFLGIAALAFVLAAIPAPALADPKPAIGLGFKMTWLGQSFFRIETGGGKVILTDPWARGNTLYPYKGADGKEDLSKVMDADVILITHGHLDHLGDIIEIAKSPSAKKDFKIVSPAEIMLYLWEQGVPNERLQPLGLGGTAEVAGAKVTMVKADHSSSIGSWGPKSPLYGGIAAGFVIEVAPKVRIYHAGDTAAFEDMRTIHRLHRPLVAILPIGGIFTMGPEEAAYAVSLLKPKWVVPMHYGGTFQLPGSPEEFRRKVKKARVIVPTPGQAIE